MPITATSIPLIDEASVSRWDGLRARSRLCGDAEDRDGGLTTYWTTPKRLHLTPRGKEPMTMSDPDVEPDDPRRLAQIRARTSA